MNRFLFGVLLAVALALSASDALAQQGKGKGKGKPDAELSEQQDRAKDAADEAEDRAEEERERAEEMREEAEKSAEKAREQAENEEGFGHDLDDDQARGTGKGNEKSQEMRARRDERKAIKAEYDANHTARQDGVDKAADAEAVGAEAADAEATDDEQQKKDKKPWWKFWGD